MVIAPKSQVPMLFKDLRHLKVKFLARVSMIIFTEYKRL